MNQWYGSSSSSACPPLFQYCVMEQVSNCSVEEDDYRKDSLSFCELLPLLNLYRETSLRFWVLGLGNKFWGAHRNPASRQPPLENLCHHHHNTHAGWRSGPAGPIDRCFSLRCTNNLLCGVQLEKKNFRGLGMWEAVSATGAVFPLRHSPPSQGGGNKPSTRAQHA